MKTVEFWCLWTLALCLVIVGFFVLGWKIFIGIVLMQWSNNIGLGLKEKY